MASLEIFSEYISNNLASLGEEVVYSVVAALQQDIPKWEAEQAVKMYSELLDVFGKSLLDKKQAAAPEVLVEWSKKNAEMQVASGGELATIVLRYPPTREIFSDLFTRISIELGMSITENALIIKRINAMLDISLNETFFAFERLSEACKKESQKELVKLSAPIVPIKDDVVVIPLIGYIDESRTRHIMDHVIPKLTEMGVQHVITDFSGVLTINQEIAEGIFHIGGTLRLMGIHVISAGLRPDLAQTIVNSGIDMSAIRAYATVKHALQSIN
ncbi:STAS domain-containing protein [Planococcus sp. YIM B11945]|uniref:STAS domain-containing protein n=1 Tax=Planococcus sp. YIM B11945 TaxID=3435410 RepID=UPI003D7D3357